MRIRKIATIALCALLALSIFTLAGCSNNQASEELITEKLTEELDSYKNLDDEAMSAITSSAEMSILERSGLNIDGQELAAAIFDGFDYNIDDVVADGDQATATVTLVFKDFSNLQDQMSTLQDNLITEIHDNPDMQNMSQDELMDLVSERIMDAFAACELKEQTMDINYELQGNTWTPVNSEAIVNTIAGSIS